MIIVDFTKWGLVVDGNVHCFVVCVLYGEELKEKKPKKPLGIMILLVDSLLTRQIPGSQASNTSIFLRKVQRKAK